MCSCHLLSFSNTPSDLYHILSQALHHPSHSHQTPAEDTEEDRESHHALDHVHTPFVSVSQASLLVKGSDCVSQLIVERESNSRLSVAHSFSALIY